MTSDKFFAGNCQRMYKTLSMAMDGENLEAAADDMDREQGCKACSLLFPSIKVSGIMNLVRTF